MHVKRFIFLHNTPSIFCLSATMYILHYVLLSCMNVHALLISLQSVCKTGRLVVAHEAPITAGFGAELAATVQVICYILQTNLYLHPHNQQ